MENSEQIEEQQPRDSQVDDTPQNNEQEAKPKREKKSKAEAQQEDDNADDEAVDETPGSSSTKEQRDQSNRQNRGRRQPNRQEDSMKQQKKVEYRVKNSDGQAAGNETEAKRPQTTRARSSRRAAPKDGAEAEEYKGGTGARARSTRRRRNQSSAPDGDNAEDAPTTRGGNNRKPQKKEPTQQEKARQVLDKKREKMSKQYEPFVPKRTFVSKFGEYQFAEWRKRRNNLFVTIDTIVPPMPKKPLQEPDDAQYHLEVAAIDEQIEKMTEQFNDLVAEQHEARTSMKEGQQGRNPIRDQLRELFGELNTYNQEKKECFAKIEDVEKQIQNFDRDLQKVRKNVHPIYNDETKLEKGVKELEKRLTTTNWSRTDEAKLMKEIDQVKSSKPFFEKIAKIRAKIADLRTKKDEIRNEMAPTNKIINSLKGRIDKVKSEESVFDKDKQLKQYDLTNVRVQIDKVMEKKRDLITKKRQAKEDFYGRMCEYEIQQCLIKDIEWITQTKLMVVEKNERQSKYDQERRERNETRKKLADERKKKDDEYKAKQEERRREQEQKRKEWELQQLEQLDQNPYQYYIDLCEELIYFCAKNKKRAQQDDEEDEGPEESKNDQAADDESEKVREKRLADSVKQGKVEVAKTKTEREDGNNLNALQQVKGKKQRTRGGPSAFYYEEEGRINLDYAYIQKFGSLEISPPTQVEQLEDINKRLVTLRDALKVRGEMEQIEGKSKLTNDKSLLQGEDYTSMQSQWTDSINEETKATVKKVQNAMAFARKSQSNDDDYETPNRRGGDAAAGNQRRNNNNNNRGGQQNDRNGRQRRDGGGRRDNEQGDGRRGRPRNQETREEADDGEERKQQQQRKNANKPREKIYSNAEAFPGFD